MPSLPESLAPRVVADPDVRRSYAVDATAPGRAGRSPRKAEALLAGRRVMSTAFEAMGGRLAEDVCVPVGLLAEFVRGVEAIAERRSVLIPVSGHGGDGNLHPSIVYAYDDPEVPWLGLELGEAEMDRQRRLKAVFDPVGIMNPGKVFAAVR